jgi:hypothetical protein
MNGFWISSIPSVGITTTTCSTNHNNTHDTRGHTSVPPTHPSLTCTHRTTRLGAVCGGRQWHGMCLARFAVRKRMGCLPTCVPRHTTSPSERVASDTLYTSSGSATHMGTVTSASESVHRCVGLSTQANKTDASMHSKEQKTHLNMFGALRHANEGRAAIGTSLPQIHLSCEM